MTPVRLVIVDDEPLALERLRGLISVLGEVEIVATATGCRTGREAIIRHRPDLALLDIKMRDGTAFDLISDLPPSAAPMIAFVTAYPRYAPQAFEVEALDYLLKPVEPSRLEQLIEKAARRRKLLSAEERAQELQELVAQLREANVDPSVSYENELWVRRNGREHVRVPVDLIDWIGALDDYVSIHVGSTEHLLRASLDSLEEMLDPTIFARIHRSSIVRRANVVKVTTARTGSRCAVLRDGKRLAIGRTYAKRLGWTKSWGGSVAPE